MSSNNLQTDGISLKDVASKLRDWFRYLWSRWLILVVVGLTGGIIGLCYSLFRKPTYTATSTFVIEEGSGSLSGALGQYAGLASMVGIDIGGGGSGLFQGDNIIELYKSNNMIRSTLLSPVTFKDRTFPLIDNYVDFHRLEKKWERDPELRGITFQGDPNHFTVKQDSLVQDIVKKIKGSALEVVKPDKKLNIIRVSVKSKDQLFAIQFIEKLVENVNDFYVKTKTKKAQENVSVLQMQADSVRRELNAAISGVAISTDANPNPNPARQILRVPSQRRTVDVQANGAILEELVKNLEISKIALRNQKPLIQVIDSPRFPLENDKLKAVWGILLGGLLFGLLSVIWFTFKYLADE